MRNISEADMALSFHNAAGKAIDPGNTAVTLFKLFFVLANNHFHEQEW